MRSIAFFTRDQWVNSNRALMTDIGAADSIITLEPGQALKALAAGSAIRVGQEVMEVRAFHNNQFEIDALGTGGGFRRWCMTEGAACPRQPEAAADNQREPAHPAVGGR